MVASLGKPRPKLVLGICLLKGPFFPPNPYQKDYLPWRIQQSRLGQLEPVGVLFEYLSSELYELLKEQLSEGRKKNLKRSLHLCKCV